MTGLAADDLTLRCVLCDTPSKRIDGAVARKHRLHIEFPVSFPAAPLELSLAEPIVHPNVHPITGFVCLWDTHRTSHTVEHAVLKTAAMLGARLWNRRAEHVMQPEALAQFELHGDAFATEFASSPLVAVTHFEPESPSAPTRRRLS